MVSKKLTQELIEYLIGTCQSLDEGMSTLEIEDEELIDLEMIDDQMFRCEECSWWCEAGTWSEWQDGVCNECSPGHICDTCETEYEVYEDAEDCCKD
jgi:hypothetical protein